MNIFRVALRCLTQYDHGNMKKQKKKFSVAIVYTKTTSKQKATFAAADEDTELSAKEIRDVLLPYADVHVIPLTEKTLDVIKALRADCIVNLVEWTGLDIPLAKQAFDFIIKTGIPFTGASKENYLMNSDKRIMKQAFDAHGIPTAKWQVFGTGDEGVRGDFHYPIILKLESEHCSIGLTKSAIVHNEDELRRGVKEKIRTFKQAVLAEEYIAGREFQVTVVVRDGKPVMLPPAEIVFTVKDNEAFLTYDSRWNEHHPEYNNSELEAPTLEPKLHAELESLCLRLFRDLGFNDYTRIDLRIDKNDNIFILEANANPGLGDDDACAMTVSYKKEGTTFEGLILDILRSCMRRFGKTLPF